MTAGLMRKVVMGGAPFPWCEGSGVAGAGPAPAAVRCPTGLWGPSADPAPRFGHVRLRTADEVNG
ncbi:hypothetical protein GCM10010233_47370 [Streptomyces pseudogriseolus]|nr:hypothetical protein GCM10010233_47370 [Streptomyces gancidicus]